MLYTHVWGSLFLTSATIGQLRKVPGLFDYTPDFFESG